MKIVATVTNVCDVVHAGGSPICQSCIIELPEPLPPLLQKYLDNIEWAKQERNRYTYETIKFSILDETE